MALLGALVTVLNLLLSAVIGVRLMHRVRRRGGGVELGLGLYFFFTAFLGSGLSCGLYVGWADPSMALPRSVEIPWHAAFQTLASIGSVGAYLFTWRTFRPDSERAKGFVAIMLAIMATSLLAIGFTDGFAIHVLNGPAYWVHYLTKILFMPWVAVESFRYYGLQRRRLAVGLADPVVANRFLLWGVWATATMLMGFSEPLARFWYVHLAGSTTAWMPEYGRPIINVTVAYSSAVGLVAAAVLFLTFFPTTAYRRWVESRAARISPAAG